MPGDRRVVRAAFFTVQETGQWIGSWTPWYGFTKLPARRGISAAAGAHIAAEIHYRHTTNELSTAGASACFSVTLLGKPVSDVVVDRQARKRRDGARIAAASTLRRPRRGTALLALRPDLVAGLTSVEVAARRADGAPSPAVRERHPSSGPRPTSSRILSSSPRHQVVGDGVHARWSPRLGRRTGHRQRLPAGPFRLSAGVQADESRLFRR